MEMDLLPLLLKQMNMSLVHVPTPKYFKVQSIVRNNLFSAMIAKKTFLPWVFEEQIFCWSHSWTPQVPISPLVSAGMFRVLTNIEDGAASLEFSLWDCG